MRGRPISCRIAPFGVAARLFWLAARSCSLLRLGHRQLSRRNRFEALIGDRLSTLDRKAIFPSREPLLGSLDGGELLLQILTLTLGDLVLEQLFGEVHRVELTRLLSHVLVWVDELGEFPLDPLPLGTEELTCSIGVHVASLTAMPPQRARRGTVRPSLRRSGAGAERSARQRQSTDLTGRGPRSLAVRWATVLVRGSSVRLERWERP